MLKENDLIEAEDNTFFAEANYSSKDNSFSVIPTNP